MKTTFPPFVPGDLLVYVSPAGVSGSTMFRYEWEAERSSGMSPTTQYALWRSGDKVIVLDVNDKDHNVIRILTVHGPYWTDVWEIRNELTKESPLV